MYLIFCVLVVACLARHFFSSVVFVADHVIAAGLLHAPGLLHFAVSHLL